MSQQCVLCLSVPPSVRLSVCPCVCDFIGYTERLSTEFYGRLMSVRCCRLAHDAGPVDSTTRRRVGQSVGPDIGPVVARFRQDQPGVQ